MLQSNLNVSCRKRLLFDACTTYDQLAKYMYEKNMHL